MSRRVTVRLVTSIVAVTPDVTMSRPDGHGGGLKRRAVTWCRKVRTRGPQDSAGEREVFPGCPTGQGRDCPVRAPESQEKGSPSKLPPNIGSHAGAGRRRSERGEAIPRRGVSYTNERMNGDTDQRP